jgi:hypothetical protein
MYNVGTTIQSVEYADNDEGLVKLRMQGCGGFGAYTSKKPKRSQGEGCASYLR